MTDPDPKLPGPDPHDEALAALYRQAARAEPPARQDAAIHAAAAADLKAPRAHRPPWWLRWRLGLSVAATLVLTTSLVLLVQREQGEPGEEARKAAAERPAPARQEGAAEGTSSARQEAAAPSAPNAAPAVRSAPPAPAAPPPALGAESPPAAASPRKKEAAPRPEAFPGAPASALTGEARSDSAASPHDAAQPAREPSPPPPEAWLDDIRKLHRAGRDAEARNALATFRRSYPNHPVPPDLAPLQEAP